MPPLSLRELILLGIRSTFCPEQPKAIAPHTETQGLLCSRGARPNSTPALT